MMLYDTIDSTKDGFYFCKVDKKYRSKVNVVFKICDADGSVNT